MAIRINRVYTRTGDRCDTARGGGRRVAKDARRMECYGTADELTATVGLARLHSQAPALQPLDAILGRVQNELFNLGSLLATRAEDLRPTQPVVQAHHVTRSD